MGDSFLDRIVTPDESMFNLSESVWKRADSQPPLKARVTKSAYRVILHGPEGNVANARGYTRSDSHYPSTILR